MKNRVCGKCGGDMQKGFLNDLYYPGTLAMSALAVQQQWVAGEAEEQKRPSILGGTFNIHGFCAPPAGATNVVTYRCTACGYLESYVE